MSASRLGFQAAAEQAAGRAPYRPQSTFPCTFGANSTRAGYRARIVNVSWTADRPEQTDADTVVVGVFEGEKPRTDAPVEVGELIASGEAQPSFKALALTHAQGKRWLTVGLGPRKDLTPERARVAAALARQRARELSARVLCWEVPTTA